MSEVEFNYVGTELDLFAAATVWKSYVRRHVRPYLGRRVLEVGAGNGGTTRVLSDAGVERWLCLEPDAGLAARIAQAIDRGDLPPSCEVKVGTTADLEPVPAFDTALYMDVIEHIEDDRGELARVAGLIRPGGHLVVLVPAHQWLFTPFDRAIGHFRRYDRRMLRAVGPDGFELRRLGYLDSVGFFASLANRLILKSSMPTAKQIRFWDKTLVPMSRVVDPLLFHRFGKSVLGVWRKPEGTGPRSSAPAGPAAIASGRPS
jgi:SAM-dependent methyltransferase